MGTLLAALRQARGWSQLRVAEQLCAAAGTSSVSRNEISRWERGERVPGDFWLGWLAEVLGAPRDDLAVAAATARQGPVRRPAAPAPAGREADLMRLAHAWLADPAGWLNGETGAAGRPDRGACGADRSTSDTGDPHRAGDPRPAGTPRGGGPGGRGQAVRPARGGGPGDGPDDRTGRTPGAAPERHPAAGPADPATAPATTGPAPAAPGHARLDALVASLVGGAPYPIMDLDRPEGAAEIDPVVLAAAIDELHRLDDLVGGADLAGPAARRLAGVLGAPDGAPPRIRRRLLALVAEAAQLTGWMAADAGDTGGALAAYRTALTAASAAGDRPLGAYVLGAASHLLAAHGDPRSALLLARTGLAGTRRSAPATLRALLLHRVAFAAARCGERRVAHAALGAAANAADRRVPERDPAWLYWLDEAELSAMTGRCLAVLGRPLRAEPLLTAAVERTGEPRTAALYGAWLARVCLDLGEVERACDVASTALLDAVRAGSARAGAQMVGVRARLAMHRDVPDTRRYAELDAACRPYLLGVGPNGGTSAAKSESD